MIESSPSSETIAQAIARLTERFNAAGIETARLDARILVGRVAGLSSPETLIHSDRRLTAAEISTLVAWGVQRAGREPIGRIIGAREFWGLTFAVTPATLEPRPDSEAVIEAILAARPTAARVLDLGTGTGCLLIALLHEWREAQGLGVDISPEALQCARRNAEHHGLGDRAQFAVSNWFANVQGQFDVIVANPPYLSKADMAELAPEVRHDPPAALTGGDDGLDAYRTIFSNASRHLAVDGIIAVEIGAGQKDDVVALAIKNEFKLCGEKSDLSGRCRCLVFAR